MAKDKLEKLYQIMANSQELGVALNDDVLSQINALEENIIKEEVLPVLNEQIEPTLRAVKRKLVLVIDYAPDGTIRVNLSRRTNVTKAIKDAKEILPDPPTTHGTYGPQKNPAQIRAPKTGLVITMPDGETISLYKASETLAEFVRRIGYQKVREIGLVMDGGPLVTNRPDDRYKSNFLEVARGWYVNTHMNNLTKERIIKKIAKALNLNIKVEILK